ncbi:MAG: ribosome maturation factor RimM [Burkholderiales bacterium]|nr:16S rRNA processing protein RimM [Betaproteobacteria bacterium]
MNKSLLPTTSDPPPADWVALAEIGAPIGLKGAVRLHTLKSVTGLAIDESLLVDAQECWVRLSNGQWLHSLIMECSPQTRGLKLQLADVNDRDQAERLRSGSVGLSRSSFPAESDDEAYWADLIGCRVVNREGFDFGEVSAMQTNGEHDWLVVAAGWIPFVGHYIDDVDRANRIIRVDWNAEWFE